MKKGNKLDKKYCKLLKKIVINGVKKIDRTETGTISIFDTSITHNFKDGFPLSTTKKVFHRGMIEEQLWFLRGDTELKTLVDKDVNIWVGDAYKRYKNNTSDISPISKIEFIDAIKNNPEFNKQWGNLGPIYGKQYRNFNGIDQVQNLIQDLKNDPESRRLIVSAWNPAELHKMILPPCHFCYQCWTRILTPSERTQWVWDNNFETGMDWDTLLMEFKNNPDMNTIINGVEVPKRAISLKWIQRSSDTTLGLPINIPSYATLLMILAKICNMVPEKVSGSLGDTHIYSNHLDGVNEQVSRENKFKLPTMVLEGEFNNVNNYWVDGMFQLDNFLSKISAEDFRLVGYESHSKIYFPLSN